MSTVRIAVVQHDPKLGQVAANRHAILGRLRQAAAGGAKLVLFPECALTGYLFDSRDEALAVAEPIPGPSLATIAAACGELGVWAIVGMLERDGDRLFNACALVGPGGVLSSYRKLHMPGMGVDRFADPGDRPFAVVEAAGIKVGLLICYDGSFPEPARVLTLMGAELIVLPTNWPETSVCAAEHQMATRAMENVVYTAAADRVGEERGARFLGRSSIHGTNGERLAFGSTDREEILYADIDPARARVKHMIRVPGVNSVDRIGDRRPGFYGALVAPNGRD